MSRHYIIMLTAMALGAVVSLLLVSLLLVSTVFAHFYQKDPAPTEVDPAGHRPVSQTIRPSPYSDQQDVNSIVVSALRLCPESAVASIGPKGGVLIPWRPDVFPFVCTGDVLGVLVDSQIVGNELKVSFAPPPGKVWGDVFPAGTERACITGEVSDHPGTGISDLSGPGESGQDIPLCGDLVFKTPAPVNACVDDQGRKQKLASLTLQYTGDGPEGDAHSQKSKKVSVTGDADGATPVYIIATDKKYKERANKGKGSGDDDGDDDGEDDDRDDEKDDDDDKDEGVKGKVWFSGTVSVGGSFTIDSGNAGKKKLGGKTYVHIFDQPGGILLESVKFSTSCSEPLFIGDSFGSVQVVGFVPRNK